MRFLKPRFLTATFGVGDATAGNLRSWADGLSRDDAWRVLGELTRLNLAFDTRGEADPHRLMMECFSKLEREMSEWLQRPFDVLGYFLASRSVVKTEATGGSSFWSSQHHTFWTALHDASSPTGAPIGVRALFLTEASPNALISSRIGPLVCTFFQTISTDPVASRRVSIFVEKASDILRTPVGELLGDTLSDYQRLIGSLGALDDRQHLWKTKTGALLAELEASLPTDLQERSVSWFEHFRSSIAAYQPPPSAPRTREMEESQFELLNAHFLNNWD